MAKQGHKITQHGDRLIIDLALLELKLMSQLAKDIQTGLDEIAALKKANATLTDDNQKAGVALEGLRTSLEKANAAAADQDATIKSLQEQLAKAAPPDAEDVAAEEALAKEAANFRASQAGANQDVPADAAVAQPAK